jgi:3-hydroxybutyryl-CoA dehydratase
MSAGTVLTGASFNMLHDLHGYYLEDLAVGMTEVFSKTVTDADISLFAGVTGDTNPVHLNQEFAEATMFKGRIAHGMLCAGLISAVLGTKLPGPGCIYIGQNLSFKAPVKIGDTVSARVTVREIIAGKRRVVFDTQCFVRETLVVDGEATLLVTSRASLPKAAE